MTTARRPTRFALPPRPRPYHRTPDDDAGPSTHPRTPLPAAPPRQHAGGAARAARGAARATRSALAQVLLRPARLAPVRSHHRAGRVLPHPHRGGDLRAPCRRHGARDRPAGHARGPGRGQLREGDAAAAGTSAGRLRGDRHLGGVPARGAADGAAAPPRAGRHRRRHGLLRCLRPAPGRAAGPVRLLLPRFQHRQLHARGGAGLPGATARARQRRRAAGRRRPREAGGRAGTGLRRRARRHRRLQPEPAAACQPPDRRRLLRPGVAPPCLLERGAVPGRDAPAGPACPEGALGRR